MMKRVLIFLMVLFAGLSLVKANELDSLFNVANELYHQKNYAKANLMYDGLIREGVESESLYFNYANTCLHQEEISKAIAYYYKALRIDPDEVDIINNLQYAQKQLGVNDPISTQFLSGVSSTLLYSLTIVAFWMSVLSVLSIYVFYKKGKRKRMFLLSAFLIIVTSFFSVISVLRYQEDHIHQYGIAINESILYQQASTLSNEIYEVFDGQKVKILNIQNGWLQIQTERKKSGWMKSEDLIRI